MKLFAFVTFVACLAVAVNAASYGGGGGYGAAAPASASSYSAPAGASYSAPAHAPASYGHSAPVTIPAPPCPKNYLFSCSPNLSLAPCSQAAAGHGSAGAYSHDYPVFAVPQY